MADASFNPYHQWLGLERSVLRPNHYQLLGLAPSEQNVQRIAAAANRAMAQVRSCQPGPRSAEWERVLKQIAAAAACLCDPARRAEYDRQQGMGDAGMVGGRTYNRPVPRSRVAPAPGPSAALPMQAPQGIPTAYPHTAAGTTGPSGDPMAPVVPASPMGAAPVQGNASAHGAGHAVPATATPIRPATPAAAAYGYPPVGQGPVPVAVPLTAVPAGRVATPVPVTTVPIRGKNSIVISKARRRTKSSSMVFLAVSGGICMMLLAVSLAVIVVARQVDNSNRQGSRPAVRAQPFMTSQAPSPETVRRPAASSRPAPSNGERTRQASEQPEQSDQSSDPGAPDPAAQAGPPWSSGRKPVPVERQTEPSWGQAGESMPNAKSEPPGSGKTPRDAVDVKPEDIAALARTLKTAHAAILDREYDTGIAELKKVARLPKRPEHFAKYERLILLANYAKQFQSALRSAINGLHAGDDIEVGNGNYVGFVKASEGSITLRVTGANRTYAMDKLPPGLAVALADRWLKKDDPVSLAVKGAFVASLKDANDEQQSKARQWLEEASRRGIEGGLQKVLDDKYDLQ